MLEDVGYLVVEEAATDVIALDHALGCAKPWEEPGFVGEVVALQRRRRALGGLADRNGGIVFFDRSPVCTLALSRYAALAPSSLLALEVDRALSDGGYEDVFFVRNQGFVQPTAARRISFADSLAFERIHEQTYRDLGFRLVDVPAGPPSPTASRSSSGRVAGRSIA